MQRLPFFIDPEDPPSKQALLESALDLFVRDGVREASLRAIATRAGFSNPVLFKFFENKDALALHLFERCYERLVSDVARVLTAPGRFDVRLRALLTALLRLFDESPEAVLFVTEELRRFWPRMTQRLKARTALTLVRGFFEDGVKAGVVGKDVSVPMLVTAFWGTLAQFCRQVYFREVRGTARAHVGELEALISKMAAA
ncbi:MAG: TetR/AcrR family transcriptional regulator [Polyangia bacterium]